MKNKLKKLIAVIISLSFVFACIPYNFAANTLTEYTTGIYSFNSYVKTRFWEGDTVYNESVFPLENKDGSIFPISLMYSADQIVSVRDGTLKTLYTEGTDYILEDGKLVILESGNIPCVPYTDHYADTTAAPMPESIGYWSPLRKGGYTLLLEGSYYHKNQLAVTYKHSDNWSGPIPESKIEAFAYFESKA